MSIKYITDYIYLLLLMQAKIREQLVQDYPELRSKRTIVEYYVKIEVPERQAKIINWWSNMIDAAIRRSTQVYLSPSDLENIFTIHGLKPTPLSDILDILSGTERYQWRGRQLVQQPEETRKESFFSRLKSWLKPRSSTPKLTKHQSLHSDNKTQIISTNFLNQMCNVVKSNIELEVGVENHISLQYLIGKLRSQLALSVDSIKFVVKELQNKSFLLIETVQGQELILYSMALNDFKNSKWVEAQKAKFQISESIKMFEKRLQAKNNQEVSKLGLAKKMVEKDKNRAKSILTEVQAIRKTRQAISDRIRALRQALEQLQANASTAQVMGILSEANEVIRVTMRDPSQIDNIIEQGQEIKMNQDQFNRGFSQMSNDGDMEEDVDSLMAQLENEVKIKNKRQAVNNPQQGLSINVRKQANVPSVLFD